jgi:hypothetical protein
VARPLLGLDRHRKMGTGVPQGTLGEGFSKGVWQAAEVWNAKPLEIRSLNASPCRLYGIKVPRYLPPGTTGRWRYSV